MRGLALIAVLALPGCSGSPASLGITGPGQASPLAAPEDSMTSSPGVPDAPNGYGPSVGPSQTGGKYFNYN